MSCDIDVGCIGGEMYGRASAVCGNRADNRRDFPDPVRPTNEIRLSASVGDAFLKIRLQFSPFIILETGIQIKITA